MHTRFHFNENQIYETCDAARAVLNEITQNSGIETRRKWPVLTVVTGRLPRWIGIPNFIYGETTPSSNRSQKITFCGVHVAFLFRPTEERAYFNSGTATLYTNET